MRTVFIERDDRAGDYKAIRDKHVLLRGATQKAAGDAAHKMFPDLTVLAERQEKTSKGSKGQWRHLHGPRHNSLMH